MRAAGHSQLSIVYPQAGRNLPPNAEQAPSWSLPPILSGGPTDSSLPTSLQPYVLPSPSSLPISFGTMRRPPTIAPTISQSAPTYTSFVSADGRSSFLPPAGNQSREANFAFRPRPSADLASPTPSASTQPSPRAVSPELLLDPEEWHQREIASSLDGYLSGMTLSNTSQLAEPSIARRIQACAYCKQLRKRCEGGVPCLRCLRRGIECVKPPTKL